MGEPDAGNLQVRFDEGEGNPLPTLLFSSERSERVVDNFFCEN